MKKTQVVGLLVYWRVDIRSIARGPPETKVLREMATFNLARKLIMKQA